MLLSLIFCVAGGSVVLTYLLSLYAPKYGLFDIPNERSSHVTPIPRAGGIAIFLNFILGLLVLYDNATFDRNFLFALGLGSIPVFCIGLWDDKKPLPARVRLLGQLVGIVWFFTYAFRGIANVPPVNIGIGTLTGTALVVVFYALFVAWMTNLYNFMDGIDGLAGTTGVVSALTLGILSLDKPGLPQVYFVFSSAVAGFLVWNWRPARIFMGDCGSTLIGFVFAVLAILGQVKFGFPLLATAAVLSPFIADATFTLIMRVVRGFRPYHPHKTFGFHRLVEKGWGVHRISTFYSSACAVWGGTMASLILRFPESAGPLIILCYSPLVLALFTLRAGMSRATNPVNAYHENRVMTEKPADLNSSELPRPKVAEAIPLKIPSKQYRELDL